MSALAVRALIVTVLDERHARITRTENVIALFRDGSLRRFGIVR